MTIVTFISVSLLIFVGWHIFVSVLRKLSAGESIVYAGLLMAAQIVLTELLLGMFGALKLPALLVINISVSGGLLAWLILARRALVIERLSGMGRQFASSFQSVLTPANVALVALGIFLTIWFCVATYFLPPRGIDDLVAHLPPIYQSVLNQEVSLLPIHLRGTFAMPLNGEFLFMWPLIFFHADTFIDFVQFVVALYGMFVVFALARRFEVERNDAVFVGLLFLFTPLVLGQAGSNYVDLIVGVCHLTLVYAAVRFWQTGDIFHLIMLGIASGFGLGIKYNMLVAVAAVQPIIIARLWCDKSLKAAVRGYGYYFVYLLPLCIYWYIRNYLKSGYPLYPYRLDFTGLHAAPHSTLATNFPSKPKLNSGASTSSALSDFLHDPVGFSLSYMFQDIGLGSFHGGFGVVFWGLGVPAIGFCIYKAVQATMRRSFFPVLFWGQVPLIFFVYFLQIYTSRLQFNQRLIVVVIGFGLLAFGIVLRKLRREYSESVPVIRSFCVAASILAVVHLAGYFWPSFQIKQPVADWISDERTSEYKYFVPEALDLSQLRAAWEPLDFLTRSGNGWAVYMAAPWGRFWTTPTFGSHLQNRIWNFQEVPVDDPDAYIFHRMNDRRLYYARYPGGRKITPEQVWSDRRYEIVTQTTTTQLWASSSLLLEPEIRERLITYYARTFGSDINALGPVADKLSDDGVLITESPWAHGLKYLSLTGTLRMPVYIVPPGKVKLKARQLGAKKVITIGKPLLGYESESVVHLPSLTGPIVFYENRIR